MDITTVKTALPADEPLKGRAGPVLRRLLGYVGQYKGLLAVSVLFAVVVAGSLTGLILGIGVVVETVFGAEAEVYGKMDGYAEQVRDWSLLNGLVMALPMPQAEPPASLDPPKDPTESRLRSLAAAMRHNTMPALYISCFLVLALTVLAGIARYLQEYFAGVIGAAISVRLAQEMFDNIIRCSLRFYEENTTGEIIARFTNDVFQVNRGLSNVFTKVMREPIKMLAFLGVAIASDWMLTIVGLCVMPPVVFIILRVGNQFKKNMRRSLQRVASLASLGNEVFGGIDIVKGYCMEDYERERAAGELANLKKHLVKMVKANAAVGPLVETVLILGVVGFVIFTGYRLQKGLLQPDALAQLFLALAMILDPVRKLSVVHNMLMGSVASAERVFEFIDVKPDIVEKPQAKTLEPLRESLRFHEVTFEYKPGQPVLKGFDLDIRKGEMIALVGFSGAGKSTVAKLIPRFYDPAGGAITIDGVDLRDVTFESLRNQIGIVTQDTVLFNESIRANIAFGRTQYADERVLQAAQAAHAEAFIRQLPQGFDTVIGESGGTLSGGQRQRIAIARAIVKDPAILILDEATSSLDSDSEQAIQRAIDEFVVGRTTIVIAHRLSTVLRADRIVVLDAGCIAEIGTHQELIAQDGIYRRLYDTQFGITKDAVL